MAGDVVSMSELFPAISMELDQALVPMHYRKLTLAGLYRLGFNAEKRKKLNWSRQMEDVREKMLKAGQFGCFYLGKPYCLGAKRIWFQANRINVPGEDDIVMSIPGELMASEMKDALLRSQHMVQKHATSPERLNEARANGLTIEAALREYFKSHWPAFYREAANKGQYATWCDHDFRLVVNGYDWKVDVSGQRLNGTYGNPGSGKKAVDWHLLARLDYGGVVWEGVVSGKKFGDLVQIEETMPAKNFAVYLNCYREGLPYDQLRTEASC